MVLLWVPLRKTVGSLDEFAIIQSVMKMVLAGVGCGMVMHFMKPFSVLLFPLETFLGVLMQVVVSAGVAGVVYLGLSYLMRSEELNMFLSAMHKRIFAKMVPSESVQPTDSTSS